MLRAGLCLLFVLAAALPVTARGHSCGDYWEEVGTTRLRPSASDSPAPTNTLLWLILEEASGYGEVTLEDAARALVLRPEGGEPVAVEVEGSITSPRRDMVALRPTEALQPETSYQAWWAWPTDVEGEEQDSYSASFLTGDGPDDDPPSVPVEQSRYLESESIVFDWYCGSWSYWDVARFDVEGTADWQLLDSRSPSQADWWAETAWTAVDGLSEVPQVEANGHFQPGGRLEYRFSALDLAGNSSGWSEVQDVTMPLAGCSSTRQSWSPLLLPFALLGLRRPRSRRAGLRCS